MIASRYDAIRIPIEREIIATDRAVCKVRESLAMSDEEDLSLIRRVATKDRQAFEGLYHQYYPRLLGYLLKLLRRHELAEEVLNDVMLVVWNEASRFRHASRLSTWIFGIAYHKALKALGKRSEKPLDVPSDMRASLNHEAPEDTMIRQETTRTLVNALQALSPEQRSVVELAFYHGFSYREIAEIVDCPVNTVKTRMLHARKRLGQLLPDLGIYQHLR